MQDGYQSGTEVRDHVRRTCEPNADFRKGVIWASANRFPVVYTCVDVAVLNYAKTKIVLGQHADGTDGGKLRLPGGFADPGSATFEEDAYREVREETGMGIGGDLAYLGSFNVNDYRYRSEPDIIRTILFLGYSPDGKPRGADDFANAQYHDLAVLRECYRKVVAEAHLPLIERVLDHVD